MNLRSLAKALAPPVLLNLYQRWSGNALRFSGRPADWPTATRMSSGYDAEAILARVTRATQAIIAGEARFERDGVLFDKPDYPFAILAALWRAAAKGGGQIDVVDFGGSLGSTYRQCRPVLDGLRTLRWRIVEQAGFVATGRAEFADDELTFFGSLDELPPPEGEQIILASSVLQYLERPYEILAGLARLPARHLIIDRTPMGEMPADRLCIQNVPRRIYDASYPCWIFSRSSLLEHLSSEWRVVCDFTCPEGACNTDDGAAFEFRGLVMERRT